MSYLNWDIPGECFFGCYGPQSLHLYMYSFVCMHIQYEAIRIEVQWAPKSIPVHLNAGAGGFGCRRAEQTRCGWGLVSCRKALCFTREFLRIRVLLWGSIIWGLYQGPLFRASTGFWRARV